MKGKNLILGLTTTAVIAGVVAVPAVIYKDNLVQFHNEKIVPWFNGLIGRGSNENSNILVNLEIDGTITTLTVKKGTKVSELEVPKKENHNFIGWKDVSGNIVENSVELNEDTVLIAVFEEIKTEFSIKLNYNNEEHFEVVKVGELIQEPEMPTYENLEYIGFFDIETNEQFDFTKSPTKDMTLKARYKQKTLIYSQTGRENYEQKQAESVRLKIDYKLTDVNDKIYLPQDYYEYVGKEFFRNVDCDYYTLSGASKHLAYNGGIEVKELIPQDILDNKEYVDTLELELYLFNVHMGDVQFVEVYTVTSDTRGVLAVDFAIGENSELRVSEKLTPSATLVLIIDEYMSVMTGNFQKLLLTGDTLTIPAQDVEACSVEGFKGAFYMNFANQQPFDLSQDLILDAVENKTGLALFKIYEPIKTFVNLDFQNLYNQNKNDYLRLKVKLNNPQEFFTQANCVINGTLNGTLNFYGLKEMINVTSNAFNLTLTNLTEEDYYKIGMTIFADIELELYLKMDTGTLDLKSLSMFTILECENGANSGIDTSSLVISG